MFDKIKIILLQSEHVLLLVVVVGDFGLSSRYVDGLLTTVGGVRGRPVRLLILVEADLRALQHNTDLVPRSRKEFVNLNENSGYTNKQFFFLTRMQCLINIVSSVF